MASQHKASLSVCVCVCVCVFLSCIYDRSGFSYSLLGPSQAHTNHPDSYTGIHRSIKHFVRTCELAETISPCLRSSIVPMAYSAQHALYPIRTQARVLHGGLTVKLVCGCEAC
ncbi:hypothetical protein LY78DRAFT_654971 [Colletotrichum sublineola]|nr:hypothetical protein LY78DRAFT_654971 [Colletotrichum sublineola]